MTNHLITVAEAAQLKGVSRSAIYKAIEQGRLNSQRVLGRVALSRHDVMEWPASPTAGRPKGQRVSDAVKDKISKSQKRRWDQRKKRSNDS